MYLQIACTLLILALLCTPSRADISNLTLSIPEGLAAHTVVGDLATSLSGPTVGFFISESRDSHVFRDLEIDPDTGIISTMTVLDRETRGSYEFVVATLAGEVVKVRINVEDVNDHSPVFPLEEVDLRVSELSPPGSRFHLEGALDQDAGQFGTQGYRIREAQMGERFRLEQRSASGNHLNLDLVLDSRVDREVQDFYALTVEAFDGGIPSRIGRLQVNIWVLDENDNPPVFNQSKYDTSIPENAPVGSSVCRVYAMDLDQDDNARVSYEINRRQSDPDDFFSVDETTGMVFLNKPLDFEAQDVHELIVTARDNGAQPESSSTLVVVKVQNVNDNSPVISVLFLSETGDALVSESARIGDYVARISVSDPDDQNEMVSVQLEGGDGKFTLKQMDDFLYTLCVCAHLDREEKDLYQLKIQASDFGGPRLSSETVLLVKVADANDCAPVFEKDMFEVQVSEDAPKGTSVIQMEAHDSDQGENANVAYSVLKSDWDCPVSVDADSGLVFTTGDLDRETQPEVCLFLVVAEDQGEPVRSTTATVSMMLEDVNDNEPVFQQRLYNASLMEHSTPGTCFLQVVATDADSPEFSVLVYSLPDDFQESDGNWNLFHINSQTGELCVSWDIDRDAGQTVHDILVRAEDPGGLCAHTYVHVEIQDLNDNAPVFNPKNYAISISSHTPPGTEILGVVATDADAGRFGRITYHILPGDLSALFALDKQTGMLYLKYSLTHLGAASIKLSIAAQDGGGVSSVRPAEVIVDVLTSVHAPAVFQTSRYAFTVPEDAPPGTGVGTVRATNPPDSAESVSYRISSGDPQGLFAVDAKSGLISTVKPLDHEIRPYALLFLQAYAQSSPVYGGARVNITVADVNDATPVFPKVRDAVFVSENTTPGTTVYIARAHDDDSGVNGQVTYHLSGRYTGVFAVDPNLGTVTLNQSLRTDPLESPILLEITAEDGGDPPRSATLTLTVNVDRASPSDGLAFETLIYQVEIGEGFQRDSRVIQVRAHRIHGASSNTATLVYSLEEEAGVPPFPFRIHPGSGWLYLSDDLDYERESAYRFKAVVTLGEAKATAAVVVLVLDINDNSPVFGRATYYLVLPEGPSPRGLVGQVTATDQDSGKNSRLSYSLLSDGKFFRINAETGEIVNWVELDREQRSQHTLEVTVTDQGSPRRNATASVHILVTDINDNTPQFRHLPASKERNVQISSRIPTGSLVTNVFAKDLDAGENATVTLSLLTVGAEGDHLRHFEIDAKSGDIRTTSLFKHSAEATYTLQVTARDGGSPPLEDTALIHVQVYGSEDQSGQTSTTVVRHLWVREDDPPGTVIGSVSIVSPGKKVVYSITDGDGDSRFGVNSQSGDIYVYQPLDYEAAAQYLLTAVAEDNDSGNVTMRVFVTVEDVNDHTPWFPDKMIVFALREDTPLGSLAFAFCARDEDGTYPNSALRYSLSSPPGLPFHMDSRTGRMTVVAPLDREMSPAYTFTVTASDQAERRVKRRHASVTARVFLLDVNDNQPTFKSAVMVQVAEDAAEGSLLHHFVAVDADERENGTVSYVILAGNQRGLFTLEEKTGLLRLSAPLDFETARFHRLNVGALDAGLPPLSSTQTLTVEVVDVNDHPPVFSRDVYVAGVAENREPGETVVQVSATDEDSEENAVVWYSLLPGPGYELFSINPYTGLITTSAFLDREQQPHFTLRVQARDSGPRPLSGTATVLCSVLDDNDNPPSFSQSSFQISLSENLPPSVVHTARASDPDVGENGTIRYSFRGEDHGVFAIDSHSGAIKTLQILDREDHQNYTLTIQACDGGPAPISSTTQFQLLLLDQNDNAPAFTLRSYHASVNEGLPAGAVVLSVTALDPDHGSNGDVTYSLTDDGSQGAFSVDASTGAIQTTKTLDRETRARFSLKVLATDNGNQGPLSSVVSVTVLVDDVNDNAPVCENNPINAIVSGETLPNRVVATVMATDADLGPNGTVRFFLPDDEENLFDINGETGEISMRRRVRAGFSSRKLRVAVSDRGNPALTSSCLVFVHLKGEIEDLQFTHKVYNATIAENSKAGTWLATVDAGEQSDGQLEGISYAIFPEDDDGMFSIDPHTGEIRVRKGNALDFETSPQVELVVLAEKGRRTAHCKVDVTLRDANDNAPVFDRDAYRTVVWEGQMHNTYVMQVYAYDADSGANGQIEFSIISGNHNDAFILDSVRGILATNAMLDREIKSSYKLLVQASDKGNPPLSSTAIIWLQVVDINDNSPAIPPMEPVLISENMPAGYAVTQVTANDVDLGPAITFSFAGDAAVEGAFAVDQYTGVVTLTRALDFEEEAELTLTIWASDSIHQTSGELKVQVLDVNDNSPVFNQVSYQVQLSELALADTFVLNVSATDKDSGLNGKITYRLLSSLLQGFYVQAHTGSLFTNKPIKATGNSNPVCLLIEARDGGDPVLSTITSIDVLILDINDHTPLFSQDVYTVTISEDAPIATTLLTIFASDQDWSPENMHLDYTLAAGNEERRFCLEIKATQVENRMSNVGQLVLCGPLDRETVKNYALTVRVSDRGTPRLNSSAVVMVTVSDCNDNAPFFTSTEYHVHISENSYAGTSLAQVNATDPDVGVNGLLHYNIFSGNSGGRFKLDPESGHLVVNTSLDYEEVSEYTLTIRVSDGNDSKEDRKMAFTMVFITVLDENDNSPYFLFPTFNCSVLENLPAFTHVCAIRGIDKDVGAYGQLTYSVLSSCFVNFGGVERKEFALAVDPHTGDVHTRQTLDYERENEYCLVVEARDKGDKAATVRVRVSVKGVDEFSPLFTQKQYRFLLPRNAKPEDAIGFVMALDQDGGADGVVEYSLLDPPPFFSINKTFGAIYASGPVFPRRGGKDVLELAVSARSHRPGSRTTSCQVFVNASSSAEAVVGLPLDGHMLSLSISLSVFLLILIFFIGLVVRSKLKEAGLKKMTINLNQPDRAFSLQDMKPGIVMKNGDVSNRHTPSNWSGRGSAEGETAEDQEIKWINEYPCYQRDEKRTLENPDGDAASCHSVNVGPGDFLSSGICLVSRIASTESLHHFKEEGGGEGLLVRIRERNLEGTSANSLECLDGSYTWDYLLDWEPCFQTLATVFMDIGMLPDQELQRGREDLAHPPPLITSVAQPGVRTVPPRKPSGAPSLGRRPSYPRYAYSPLARNTGLTPVAMTPTFSPSLSSLTIRTPRTSPIVSDAGVGGIRLDSGPPTASLLEAELQV